MLVLAPIIVIGVLILGFLTAWLNVAENSSYFDGLYGENTQERVWWALKDAGFNDIQVAGAMGSIQIESSFDPSAFNSSSSAMGLCQWLRQYLGQDLESFAQSRGVEWKDESTQIEFMVGWLANTGSAVEYINRNNGSLEGNTPTYWGVYYGPNAWRNYTPTGNTDQDIDYSTRAYYANYETGGEGQWGSESGEHSRVEWAKKYYEKYHGKSKPANTRSGRASGSVRGTREGIYTSGCSGKKYKTFLQNPPDNAGWFHNEGCWATAQAVIMSSFGWNGTPNQLASWHLGNSAHYSAVGLRSQTVYNPNVNGIVNCLNKGYGIHIRVSGSTLTTYNGSNYFNGHSLNILDYRRRNGRYEFYVHDPYYADTTYGWGDAQNIVNSLAWYEYVWK